MSHVVCFAALSVSKNIPCSTFPSENLLLSVLQRYNILSSKYSTISMEQCHILQYNVSQFLSWEFPVFCAKKLLHFFYIKITTFHFENLPHLASKFCYILLRSYKQFCAKILVQLRLKIYDIMMKNYCILSQRVNYTFLCIKWYGDKHNHLRRSTCCSFYL